MTCKNCKTLNEIIKKQQEEIQIHHNYEDATLNNFRGCVMTRFRDGASLFYFPPSAGLSYQRDANPKTGLTDIKIVASVDMTEYKSVL